MAVGADRFTFVECFAILGCFFQQLLLGYTCFMFGPFRTVFGNFRFEQPGNPVVDDFEHFLAIFACTTVSAPSPRGALVDLAPSKRSTKPQN